MSSLPDGGEPETPQSFEQHYQPQERKVSDDFDPEKVSPDLTFGSRVTSLSYAHTKSK